MSVHLQKEMEILKNRLLNLGIMVEEQMVQAIQAFTNQDEDLAHQVMEADLQVDMKELEIEEECLKVLALHQPVAVDLRLMVAALKINNDLERIGDLSVRIAKRVMWHKSAQSTMAFDMVEMSEKTRSLYRNSIDAMINQDVKLAERVCEDDDAIDDMLLEARKKILRSMESGQANMEHWIAELEVAQSLERIADHATNIAEDVIYMVRGEITRHHLESN
jgi:phosphate transport system protein